MKAEKVWRMVSFAEDWGLDVDVRLVNGWERQGRVVSKGDTSFAIQYGRTRSVIPVVQVEWMGLALE